MCSGEGSLVEKLFESGESLLLPQTHSTLIVLPSLLRLFELEGPLRRQLSKPRNNILRKNILTRNKILPMKEVCPVPSEPLTFHIKKGYLFTFMDGVSSVKAEDFLPSEGKNDVEEPITLLSIWEKLSSIEDLLVSEKVQSDEDEELPPAGPPLRPLRAASHLPARHIQTDNGTRAHVNWYPKSDNGPAPILRNGHGRFVSGCRGNQLYLSPAEHV